MPLDIRAEPAELDFLALGALVHRLDPGTLPFRCAHTLDVHVSGGEYNVAANLSSCFGLRTGIATAMVAYGIGELVQSHVRAKGVRPFYHHFAHDGVRGPNIATVYSDRGQGVRAPVVFYNRANEAAALLKPGDFPWDQIMAGGIRWFHSGGIFAALSDASPELIVEGLQAATAAGAVTSFDLNFREKLWSGRGQVHAQQVLRRIVAHVDVLIGNEEDLQTGLGIPGPKVAGGETDAAAFFAMIERVRAQFPRVRLVATSLRQVASTNRHEWAAMMWLDDQQYLTPVMHLDVLDRIGGGDGFASGLIYGLLDGRAPDESLRLGWAHGALLTTYPGDLSMASLAEVEALARGSTARVQR